MDEGLDEASDEGQKEGADAVSRVRTFLADAVSGVAMSYLVVVAALVAAAMVPMAFGWQPHVAVSGSMRPTFDPGEVVLVAPAEPSRFYDPPTVITYRQDGTVVTHRVVDTQVTEEGTSYGTKGDANRAPDSGRVDHEDVVGAVRLVVPLVGQPLLWARHRQWPALSLVVVSVLGALSAARREPPLLQAVVPGAKAVQAGS